MQTPHATSTDDAYERPASGWTETTITVMWILLVTLALYVCSGAVAMLWL